MGDETDWQAMLDKFGAVEFVASRAVALRLLGGLGLFLLVGVWLITVGGTGTKAVGAAVAFLCLFGVPVAAARWITGRPILVVDSEGMSFGRQRVSWHEVTGVTVYGTGARARVVQVMLTGEADERVKGQLNPLHRFIELRNENRFGGPAMSVLNVSGFDPQTMAAWLTDVHSANTGHDDA